MDLSKLKEEYRSIKAPDRLRERVMSSRPVNLKPIRFDRSRMIKTFSSIAACFAVVAIIAIALTVYNGDYASISISGTVVDRNAVEINGGAAARSVPAVASFDDTLTVEFTVECKNDCRVSVNCGEIVEAKAEYSDGETLVWNVTDIPEEGAMLYLEYGNKTSTYTLVQSSESGVWTINKNKTK